MELSSVSQAALDIISVAFQSSRLSVSNYVITLLVILEESLYDTDLPQARTVSEACFNLVSDLTE